MRTLCVTGSRLWSNYGTIWSELGSLACDGYTTLLAAPDNGAGRIALHAGERLGYLLRPQEITLITRNERMVAQSQLVVVFREKGRGNSDCDACIAWAEKMGVEVRLLR